MRICCAAIVCLCALAASGCATTSLTVTKVQEKVNPKGIRYSLPKPFLLVTPSPSGDGSMTVEVIYLPDESNTYAIDAHTKRGKYELTVGVKDGLLNNIAWSQQDAKLLADSINAGATVLKSELDRRRDDKKAQDAKADEAAKAADAEVKALQDDLAAKDLELQLAIIELDAAQARVDAGDTSAEAAAALRKAKVDRDKASATRDFAADLVTKAQSKLTASAANLPQPAKGPAVPSVPNANESLFWGPVLYEIIDEKDVMSLKAVSWHIPPPKPASKGGATQLALRTAAPPKDPPADAPVPKVLGSRALSRIWHAGKLQFDVEFDTPLASVRENERKLTDIGPPAKQVTPTPFTAILLPDRKRVRIEFPAPLKAGTYQVEIPFTAGNPAKPNGTTILLTVEK
jgi:hypothetical protein